MELFKLLGTVAIDGVEKAEKAVDSIAKKFETAGSKLESVGKGITSAGKALTPISGAVGGIGLASGKMALAFQDSMANINTLLDDDSHLSGYEDKIRAASNETGISLGTMASGMYQAISSLGDGGTETESIFETMAKAAKAGGAEVSDSVALISAGMKGYNSVNDETAQKISDLAFQTAKLGVTTFPEMAASMQPLFPLANSLNISYEELFGSMATLTGVTGNTSEVSTQLKAVFSNLMKPTESMASLIEKYGYSSGQAMIEQEGLSGVLEIIQNETGGQADKLAELFSSTEAVTAVTALTGAQFDTFNEKLTAMNDATGTTQTAYDKLNTSGNTIQTAWNELKNTGEELGESLLVTLAPIISELSDKIHSLSEWFNGLDDSQKQTIVTIGLVIAAAAPVLMFVGTMITTIGTLMTTVSGLMTAVAALNPVMLLIGVAIAAVIAVGVLLYKNWDTVKAKATELWTHLTEAFNSIKETILNVWNGIWDGMKGILNSILGGIETMVNGAIKAINKLIDGLNSIVSAAGKVMGLNVKIPNLSEINLPRLEKGGVLEKGQMGFLEGNGAEAVVPLDQNRAWISAVARDMENIGMSGNNEQTQRIIELLEMLIDLLPDTLKEAFAAMKFDVNNREFARLVKAVG